MTEAAYLVRNAGRRAKRSRAHLWDGSDTLCRMWSTGGIKRTSYRVFSEQDGHEICRMCQHVRDRRDGSA